MDNEKVPAASASLLAKGWRHVAYYDEGGFHWVSGIAPRDCELYQPASTAALSDRDVVLEEAAKVAEQPRVGTDKSVRKDIARAIRSRKGGVDE
tara:strand:- start:590 stop:871 length:282 start_codon:yes stop_codon:yes gene_type:complete